MTIPIGLPDASRAIRPALTSLRLQRSPSDVAAGGTRREPIGEGAEVPGRHDGD